MATKLFLRTTQDNGLGPTYFDMVVAAGAAAATAIVNTVGSGTEIQWTQTAGGAVIQFVSGRAPAGGFTLTATDISIWAQESNGQANCGGRYRVFKRTAAGVETEIGGGPFNDGVEFGTSAAEMLWTGNVTDTVFAEDDRILLKIYITNIGTMGSGRTCTLTYNAANAATGDSFFNIAETVSFKAETPPAQNITPGLHTNGQSFFAPTVAPGAVNLTPGLHTNDQIFFALSVVSVTQLTIGLHSNTQTFFAPTVTPGPVTVTIGLHINTQVFFAPTVAPGAATLAPDLHSNTQGFFAPTVAPGAVALTPTLFANVSVFHAPTLAHAGGGQTVEPGLFINTQVFFAPTAFSPPAPSPNSEYMILVSIADILEEEAGSATPANPTSAGKWLRIANAAEALAGAGTQANHNQEGHMRRAALALSLLAGVSAGKMNSSAVGYLKQMVVATEALSGVHGPGTIWRRLCYAVRAAFDA